MMIDYAIIIKYIKSPIVYCLNNDDSDSAYLKWLNQNKNDFKNRFCINDTEFEKLCQLIIGLKNVFINYYFNFYELKSIYTINVYFGNKKITVYDICECVKNVVQSSCSYVDFENIYVMSYTECRNKFFDTLNDEIRYKAEELFHLRHYFVKGEVRYKELEDCVKNDNIFKPKYYIDIDSYIYLRPQDSDGLKLSIEDLQLLKQLEHDLNIYMHDCFHKVLYLLEVLNNDNHRT